MKHEWVAGGLLAMLLAAAGGCSGQRQALGDGDMIVIDGKRVALSALYPADTKPVTVRPIGYVVNNRGRSTGGFGISGTDISEIRLYPGMAKFMKGLEDETSLLILWHFHQARPIRSVFKRGWDGKEVGVFASRTPDRPTPIGVTEVELVEVKGTTLVVRNLDAFNGTPVLDIKVSMASLTTGANNRREPPAE